MKYFLLSVADFKNNKNILFPMSESLLLLRHCLKWSSRSYFQSQQSVIQRVVPSHCVGGYRVFLWGILNSDFFGTAREEGAEGGMWWKSAGLAQRVYLGLGSCGLSYMCFRGINRSLKSRDSKTEIIEATTMKNLILDSCERSLFYLCEYIYLTLSSSLDSFLFSSIRRTLSLSYFCL